MINRAPGLTMVALVSPAGALTEYLPQTFGITFASEKASTALLYVNGPVARPSVQPGFGRAFNGLYSSAYEAGLTAASNKAEICPRHTGGDTGKITLVEPGGRKRIIDGAEGTMLMNGHRTTLSAASWPDVAEAAPDLPFAGHG